MNADQSDQIDRKDNNPSVCLLKTGEIRRRLQGRPLHPQGEAGEGRRTQ